MCFFQAASAYVDAYYTVSIGQWIAHDLRHSLYAHRQRLSMSYSDKQQAGPLISTITDDINAVQRNEFLLGKDLARAARPAARRVGV